ncbi:MAG TPA: ribosome maturation factor RimM [Spirochaetales bacterium]|nr:ribosome maturation factor RimM [Spirochaetales bacterium]HPG86824.1 ribosome maturation factor RimM [Spirochaetales bacterium]HPM73723.1 ribosome maturation factor RimM [Spirochaetales bacterium]
MDLLALGRVGKPHGVDGRLRLVSYSGETDHLMRLTEATLRGDGRELFVRIESVTAHGNGVLMKVVGYDSPERAVALSGMELWAPRDMAAPLDDDQYYYADLVGCALVAGGTELASVVAVCDSGGGDLLEVAKPDGSSAYVPFRKEFVGEVDVHARRIELVAPWILE